MKGDILCEKCQVSLGFGWDGQTHRTILAGGFHTNLCLDCTNLWGEFIHTAPQETVWESMCEVDQEISTTKLCFETAGEAAIGAASNVLNPLYKKQREIKKQLRAIGKAWVADKIPTPVTTP